jgi:Leucine-rich repeat (LRR) protein
MRTAFRFFSTIALLGILLVQCDKKKFCTCDPIPIPDEAFLAALIDAGIDVNEDGAISYEEADTVTTLYISAKQITDLSGIQHFTDLKELDCNDNLISFLDLSKNTKLEILECSRNQLSWLDVSNNPWLIQLWCMDNQIADLDVTMLPQLKYFYCSGNELKSLDVTQNGSLERLYIGGNEISDLDVSGNLLLKDLDCSGNALGKLDISSNTQLKQIFLSSMQGLTEVCVWILPFPPQGISVQRDDPPTFDFTTGCSI